MAEFGGEGKPMQVGAMDAGYEELYVQQVGPDQQGFFEFHAGKLR